MRPCHSISILYWDTKFVFFLAQQFDSAVGLYFEELQQKKGNTFSQIELGSFRRESAFQAGKPQIKSKMQSFKLKMGRFRNGL